VFVQIKRAEKERQTGHHSKKKAAAEQEELQKLARVNK
jgi:hypothetical protein